MKTDRAYPTIYCVAGLFEAIEVGATFQRSAWPAHLTLVGNFALTVKDPLGTIAAAIRDANVLGDPLDCVLGERAIFGSDQNVPVLLVKTPEVRTIHERLVHRLEAIAGLIPIEPELWRTGYRPHVTLGRLVSAEPGEVRTVVQLALARLHGSEAEIVSGFDASTPSIDAGPTPAHGPATAR